MCIGRRWNESPFPPKAQILRAILLCLIKHLLQQGYSILVCTTFVIGLIILGFLENCYLLSYLVRVFPILHHQQQQQYSYSNSNHANLNHECNVNNLSLRAYMPASVCVVFAPPSLPTLSPQESCSNNNCKWIILQLEFRSGFNKSMIQSVTGGRRHFVCAGPFKGMCVCACVLP